MPDTGTDHFSGLLLPALTLEEWPEESSATQAGPFPGIPIPSRVSAMALAAIGVFGQDGARPLEVLASESGLPGLERGEFLWRPVTEPVSDYRGSDPVTGAIHEWTSPVYTDGTSPPLAREVKTLHAIRLRTTHDIIVVFSDVTTQLNTTYAVRSIRYDVLTGTWGPVTTIYQGGQTPPDPAFFGDYHPCALELDSGRLQVYHWTNDGQVRGHYSLDGGVSWTLLSEHTLDRSVLDYGVGSTFSTLRASRCGGGVVLFALSENPAYLLDSNTCQFASLDDGVSFTAVVSPLDLDTDTSGLGGGGALDVVSSGALCGLVYLGDGGALPVLRWLTSPYHDHLALEYTVISSDPWGLLTGTSITEGEITLVDMPSGRLVAIGRKQTTSEIEAIQSTDLGETWDDTEGSIWAPVGGPVANSPRTLAAVESAGRIALFHRWNVASETHGDSVGAMWIGGYTTIPLHTGSTGYQMDFTDNWIPIGFPDGDTGWQRTTAGGSLRSLESQGMRLESTGGTDIYQRDTLNSFGLEQGIVAQANVQVLAGGSAAMNIGLEAIIEDNGGAPSYRLGVALQVNGTITVYDAGISVGSFAVTGISDPGICIQVGVQETASGDVRARVYWRPMDTSPDRAFTLGLQVDVMTAEAASNTKLRIGHFVGLAGSISKWTLAASGSGPEAAGWVEQESEAELTGRSFALGAAWLADGILLAARSGPCLRGDSWTIEPRYRFGIERATERASPRIGWKGEATTIAPPAEVLAYRWSSIGNAAIGSEVIGVALHRTNATRVIVDLYDSGIPGWTPFGEVELSGARAGLAYDQSGGALRPALPAADGPWLHGFELSGGWAGLDDLGSSRRIGFHLAGSFSGSAADGDTPAATIVLSDCDGTEPATGTAKLYAESAVILVRIDGNDYQGIRLTLPTPVAGDPWPPPDENGDRARRIGTITIGPVVAFADCYAWGRAIETAATVESVTMRDGTEVHRVLAPSRRAVEWSWTDGIDMTPTELGEALPARWFPITVGGIPGAALGETPRQFEGLTRALDGPARAVVYLPRVERLVDALTLLNRRDQHVLASLTSPVRVETVLGDELATELVRVASVNAREVI